MAEDILRKTVLLVDDEVMLVSIIKEILEDKGYLIIDKTSGLEAKNTFNENPNIFDIVVCDLCMPDISGVDLVSEIKKKRPNLPIILCTGYEDKTVLSELNGTKIDHLMKKPFDIEDLAVQIRKLLDKAAFSDS